MATPKKRARDEFTGKGGTYEVDPKTGKRKRVRSATRPEHTNRSTMTTDPTPASAATEEEK